MSLEITFVCAGCSERLGLKPVWLDYQTVRLNGVNQCVRCRARVCAQCYDSTTDTCTQVSCSVESIRVSLTEPETRTVRGNEYTYPCPTVGSVVAQFGSGYGTGIDTNWVLAESPDLRTNRQGFCTSVTVYEVTSYSGEYGQVVPGEKVTYNPKKFQQLKLYCSQKYPGMWRDPSFKEGNGYSWDQLTPPTDHFPMGR